MAKVLLLICSFDTLSQSKRKATPKIPRELLQQFITDENLEDDQLEERLAVREIDINRDGQAEYFLETHLTCGSGGCVTYIYQKVGKSSYKQLFQQNELKPKSTYTSGYRDLEGSGQSGADDWWAITYKFNGNAYNDTQCVQFHRNKKGKVTRKKCD